MRSVNPLDAAQELLDDARRTIEMRYDDEKNRMRITLAQQFINLHYAQNGLINPNNDRHSAFDNA